MRSAVVARVVLTSVLLPSLMFSQEKPDPQLTQPQAVKDAARLVELLELSHPDPYLNFGGKVAFEWQARELIRNIPQEGLRTSELAERLGRFLARLRDGHTFLYDGRNGRQSAPSNWLPVNFGISTDGLFVTGSDIAQLRGMRGYRVRGINGHPIEAIMGGVCDETPCENIFRAYARSATTVRSFQSMRNLFPNLDPHGTITYNLESPDGTLVDRAVPWEVAREANRSPQETIRQKIDSQTWLEKPARWAGLQRSDEMFYWRLFPKQRAAYFRVGTVMGREAYEVAYRENAGDVQQMLEQYYKSKGEDTPANIAEALNGIPSFVEKGDQVLRQMKSDAMTHLIVDLRGNSGGYTESVFPFFYEMYGDAFYGHRFRSAFVRRVSQLYLDKNHATLEEMRKNLNDPNLQLGGYHFEEEEPSTAEAERKKVIANYLDKHYSFAKSLEALDGRPVYTPKKIVVLCDANTFSAAFHVMAYFKDMGATVVGVPSSQSPNAFMEMTEFVLPESGLRGSISNSVQIFDPDNPKADVFHPDFEVTYSIFKKYDFDEETPLRYALDLIEEGKL